MRWRDGRHIRRWRRAPAFGPRRLEPARERWSASPAGWRAAALGRVAGGGGVLSNVKVMPYVGSTTFSELIQLRSTSVRTAGLFARENTLPGTPLGGRRVGDVRRPARQAILQQQRLVG